MIDSHDTENRLKTAPASKVHTTQPRAVEMYTLEGKHLKSFESCMAAARYLQKTSKAPKAVASNIGEAARGKYYNAYGHRWSYEGEPLPKMTPKKHGLQPRAVEMYTLEGKHLKSFESCMAAARYLQKTSKAPKSVASNIGKAARGKRYSAYGHRWSFTGEPLPKVTPKQGGLQPRAVEMYTLEGKHFMSFESCLAAARYLQETGIAPKAAASRIGEAARGKFYNIYGHRWSFTGKPLANATPKKRSAQPRGIEMLTLEGKHLKTFESCLAAAQYLQKTGKAPKATATNIRAAARGKFYNIYDHRWSFTGEPLPKRTPKQGGLQRRAVEMLTLEGKHLKTFDSLAAAARYLQENGIAPTAAANNISAAARGKQYSSYDRRWRYKVSSPSNLVGIGR